MTKLVVKKHAPRRAWAMVVGALVTAAAAGFGVYELGHYRAGFDFANFRELRSRLEQGNAELLELNARLREKVAVLERSAQIEREAYKNLEENVGSLQDEVLELKSELAFYRGIVSPGDKSSRGLKIQSLAVTPLGESRSFRIKLVLTQVLDNNNLAIGSVKLGLKGAVKGAAKDLALETLNPEGTKALAFRFRYFQDLETDILLPEGFVPNEVKVELHPQGRNTDTLERVFDWPAEES